MSHRDDDLTPQQVAAVRWLAQYAPPEIASEFVNHNRDLRARVQAAAVENRRLLRRVAALWFFVGAMSGYLIGGLPIAITWSTWWAFYHVRWGVYAER
jgi:hypothetical protein